MLACTGLKNGIEGLEIDKQIDTILPGEAGNEFGFVHRHPAGEIVRDADIQCSVSLTGEDVHEEAYFHTAIPDAGSKLDPVAQVQRTLPISVGPGSAEQRCTLHRVRDTRVMSARWAAGKQSRHLKDDDESRHGRDKIYSTLAPRRKSASIWSRVPPPNRAR